MTLNGKFRPKFTVVVPTIYMYVYVYFKSNSNSVCIFIVRIRNIYYLDELRFFLVFNSRVFYLIF